jgi:UDP-N-acetylglucosamine transferase subunit ALG13
MGNHQVELAKPLARDHYLFWAEPDTVVETLKTCDWSTIKPYPPANTAAAVRVVDEEMGFVENESTKTK